MTISSTTNTVSYNGNGSTTAFAVPYAFFGTGTTSEIEVVIATGAETVKSNGSDYTVAGGSGTTGTVTAATAPASTVKWVINRATTQTQETDYVENDPFPAESHEEALDRLTAIDQEQQRALDRTAQLPDGYTGAFDPTLPTTITGSAVLAFNAGATAFEIGPTTAAISGAAAEAAAAAASADAAAASETAAGVSETNAAASAADAAASVGGVKVSADDTTPSNLEAKLLVGASLELSTQNPGANETRTVNVADLGISTGKLANAAVTAAKASIATQGEAEAGTDTTKLVTPQRVAQAIAALSSASVNDILVYQQQQTSGTAGTAYAIGAFRTVTLNTEVTDTASIGSLATNQVTLPAGSYEFEGSITVGQSTTGSAQVKARPRLYNATDTAVVVQGNSVSIDEGLNAMSNTVYVCGQFTIASSKTFEVQVEVTGAGSLAPAAMSTGESEVYSTIKFRRYAT